MTAPSVPQSDNRAEFGLGFSDGGIVKNKLDDSLGIDETFLVPESQC